MISVNMSAKSFNSGVEYIPFKSIMIKNKEMEDQTLFLVSTLHTEVINGSEKQQYKNIKKMKKFLKTSLSILGLMAGTATRAFAATAASGIDPLTPAIIMKWGITVALISVAVGVALSMTMLTLAGIFRMFRKRKEADMWTTDIIKGLVQVLISVPTVFLLYFLAQMLFSHLSALKSLF